MSQGYKKLAHDASHWLTFSGFTLLFDPPKSSLQQQGNLLYLASQSSTDPALALYDRLGNGMSAIATPEMQTQFLFLSLPPSSYHVTAWDGINDENCAYVTPQHRATWESFLRTLPDALCTAAVPQMPELAPLLTENTDALFLRYEALELWGNVSLVVRLAPANPASCAVLDEMKMRRARVSETFAHVYNVAPHPHYTPHITLGYFADPTRAEHAHAHVREWDASIREKTTDTRLRLHTIGVYSFTDMATFFTCRTPTPHSTDA